MEKKLKVLLIGSGGREHALAWKLAQSSHVSKIVCVPGNAGTEKEKKCRNVSIAATNISALVELAKEEQFDLTVVGPEGPLIDGIVDQWPIGLRICGPYSYAALFEGSKVHAKQMMGKYGIPTAPWAYFDSPDAAKAWLDCQKEDDWVTKPDGLTGGKGVTVNATKQETKIAIDLLGQYGEAAKRFILERRLQGKEASLFLLCGADGQIIPLETAQDYKLSGDGDTGVNTGGMGAYSPASHLTPEMIDEIIAKHRPMIAEVGFTGFLYIGLMLTIEGWKVLEYNVRMGDPETQVVLPRLKTDLVEVLYPMAGGEQYRGELEWSDQVAVTVVMTEKGYPGDYLKGDVITGLDRVQEVAPGAIIFHAGTKLVGNKTVTNGGRVLAATALGENMAAARTAAYNAVEVISWGENTDYRKDIAKGI